MAANKGVCRFGAKEELLVGGNCDMVNSNWMEDKRNYLIG